MGIEPTPGVSGVSQLFQLLRDGVPRTRAELAKSTGLARSTIAARVDELMRMGLITPIAESVSTGGRPPSQFALNPSARLVLAADIGASHATLAITDLTARRSSSSTASRSTSRSARSRAHLDVENAVALLERIGARPRSRRHRHGGSRPGRALHRAAGESADHAGVGSVRRPRLGAAAPRRAGARRQRREHHGARRARHRVAGRRAPDVRQGRDRHRRRCDLGRRAAARRAGHRGRHRPRPGRARRRRALPLRQQGMPRGARVGTRDRARAARAGGRRPRTATTSSTSSSAATSTPSRRCARPAATSARCSRRA